MHSYNAHTFFMSLNTGLEDSALTGVTLMQIHMCCSCNDKYCILTHHPGSTVTLLSYFYIPIATFCRLKELPWDATVWKTWLFMKVVCMYRNNDLSCMNCSVSGGRHGVWDHLVGSVEKTGSSSLEQEVLKICDTAFGKPARMLHTEMQADVILVLVHMQ